VLWNGVSTVVWKTNIASVMTKWPAGVRCELDCRRSLLLGEIDGSVDAHIRAGGVVRPREQSALVIWLLEVITPARAVLKLHNLVPFNIDAGIVTAVSPSNLDLYK
jgi:hypothetical protein